LNKRDHVETSLFYKIMFKLRNIQNQTLFFICTNQSNLLEFKMTSQKNCLWTNSQLVSLSRCQPHSLKLKQLCFKYLFILETGIYFLILLQIIIYDFIYS